MILRWKSLARSAVLLAVAGMLGACCTTVASPESAQAGQGTCAAYIPITNDRVGGAGGQNR